MRFFFRWLLICRHIPRVPVIEKIRIGRRKSTLNASAFDWSTIDHLVETFIFTFLFLFIFFSILFFLLLVLFCVFIQRFRWQSDAEMLLIWFNRGFILLLILSGFFSRMICECFEKSLNIAWDDFQMVESMPLESLTLVMT